MIAIYQTRGPLSLSSAITLSLGLLLSGGEAQAGAVNDTKKKLNKAASSLVKDFKSIVKAERKQLYTVLDGIDAKAKAGNATRNDIYPIFTALEDFQTSVRNEVWDTCDLMTSAHVDAMGSLLAAGLTKADYPIGFMYGEGGARDEFRKDMEDAVEDTYDTVETRLHKLAKTMRSKSEVSLAARLEKPCVPRETAANGAGTGSWTTAPILSIDVVVSGSDLTTSSDGVVYLSGSAHAGTDYWVYVIHGSGFYSLQNIPVSSDDRWYSSITDVYEQNYVFSIRPYSVQVGPQNAIGIR